MTGGANSERLAAELAELERQWRETREHWKDEVGDRFEREFWEQHVSVGRSLLVAMTQLEEELARVLAFTKRYR